MKNGKSRATRAREKKKRGKEHGPDLPGGKSTVISPDTLPCEPEQSGPKCSFRHWKTALGVILVFGLFLRGVFVFQALSIPFFHDLVLDSQQYESVARALAGHDGDLADLAFMNPLYPYFLAVIDVVLGPGRTRVLVLQTVLDALTALWIYLVATVFFDRRVALTAALGYSMYGLAVIYSGVLLAESLVVFLLMGAVAALVRGLSAGNAVFLVLAGALYGAATLGRPNLIIALVMAASGGLVYCLRDRSTLPALAPTVAWVILGLSIPLLSSSVGNYRTTGSLSPFSANGGINFFLGNNPEADGMFRTPDNIAGGPVDIVESAVRIVSVESGHSLSPSQSSVYWFRRGLDWVVSNPGDAAALYLRKLMYLISARETPLNLEFSRTRTQIPILHFAFLGFGLVAPFALVGAVLIILEMRRAIPLAAFVTAYGLSLLPFFGSARFRIPMVPFLLILGAVGVVRLIDLVRERNYSAAGAVAVGVLLSAVLVNAGTPEGENPAHESIFLYNLGNRYREMGMPEEAENSY